MTPPPSPSIRPKHWIEYAAARFLASLVASLPDHAALGLGQRLADFGFSVIRYRRSEAIRRILSVFAPAMDRSTATAIARESFRNLVLTLFEGMRVSRVDRAWIAQHIDDAGGFETVRAHCASGQGAVLAVPHMGSWELAGASCARMGIPLFSISARFKNPLVDEWLRQQRTAAGLEMLTRGTDPLAAVPRLLKRGRCFAILPDVRHPRPALAIPFLGGTANIAPGMALFARLGNAPIFPCILTRLPGGRHRFRVGRPIFPNPEESRDEDLRRMTAAVMAIIEEAIRAQPGQWFWFNKRWILDPL